VADTGSLLLRKLSKNDIDAVFNLNNDPETLESTDYKIFETKRIKKTAELPQGIHACFYVNTKTMVL
jgi:hypothetical protein